MYNNWLCIKLKRGVIYKSENLELEFYFNTKDKSYRSKNICPKHMKEQTLESTFPLPIDTRVNVYYSTAKLLKRVD